LQELILSFVQEIISNMVVELALRGPVTVLDGGNCFPAYRFAQLIRRKSTQVDAMRVQAKGGGHSRFFWGGLFLKEGKRGPWGMYFIGTV